MKEVAEPFRHREHPLSDRNRRDHVVGEVSGGGHHAPGVAGRADALALAGEGDQEVMPAAVAASVGAAVRENHAAQIGPEAGLDEVRHALAQWICLLGPGEEGLQVSADSAVEAGVLRPAPVVDSEAHFVCRSGRTGPSGRGYCLLKRHDPRLSWRERFYDAGAFASASTG